MEFIALFIVGGALWWAISHIGSTPRAKFDFNRDKPSIPEARQPEPSPVIIQENPQSTVTLHVTFNLDPTSSELILEPDEPPSRLDIVIEDQNAEALSLSYEPYEWPSEKRFRSDLNFWIQHPHSRDAGKRWYAKEVNAFFEKLKVLGDYEGEWIQAVTKVALVPVASGAGVQVVLNGVVLHSLLPGSESLIRRMRRQKIEIRVTKCHARLEGGGTLTDGRQRGLYVALDLKPFRRQ